MLCPIADEPLTKGIAKEGSMILREPDMGVSPSRGTPVWIPKYYIVLIIGTFNKGATSFGKPPCVITCRTEPQKGNPKKEGHPPHLELDFGNLAHLAQRSPGSKLKDLRLQKLTYQRSEQGALPQGLRV